MIEFRMIVKIDTRISHTQATVALTIGSGAHMRRFREVQDEVSTVPFGRSRSVGVSESVGEPSKSI